MDFLKPPTDNLYKFMAIAGLVAAAFCGYVIINASGEYAKALGQYGLAIAKLMEDSRKPFTGTGPRLRALPEYNYAPPDIESTAEEYKKYNDETTAWLKEMRKVAEYPTAEEMAEYLKRPDVVDYYIKQKGFEKDTFDKFVNEVSLEDFQLKEFGPEQTVYENVILLGSQLLYTSLPMQKEVERIQTTHFYAGIGFWLSLVLAATGFPLWYFMIQRHEDQITKFKAQSLAKPKRSKTTSYVANALRRLNYLVEAAGKRVSKSSTTKNSPAAPDHLTTETPRPPSSS